MLKNQVSLKQSIKLHQLLGDRGSIAERNLKKYRFIKSTINALIASHIVSTHISTNYKYIEK